MFELLGAAIGYFITALVLKRKEKESDKTENVLSSMRETGLL